jgi:hypothetical protein
MSFMDPLYQLALRMNDAHMQRVVLKMNNLFNDRDDKFFHRVFFVNLLSLEICLKLSQKYEFYNYHNCAINSSI